MTIPSTPASTDEKQARREALSLAAGVKVWHFVHFADAASAIAYANVAPAQQAGEFVFSDAETGGVDGAYFF